MYWNSFIRACTQNIYTIYTIVYTKRNLQVRENEILARARLEQNTKFRHRPGPARLGLSDFKTDSFS